MMSKNGSDENKINYSQKCLIQIGWIIIYKCAYVETQIPDVNMELGSLNHL